MEGSRVNWAESVGWKATAFSSLNNEKTWNILNTVEEIGKENGMTDAQVSLRWLMQKPGVTAPIIGELFLILSMLMNSVKVPRHWISSRTTWDVLPSSSLMIK